MLRIRLNNRFQETELTHGAGPIELGRGPAREPVARIVVQDRFVSRDHVEIESIGPGRIRIINLSHRNTVRLGENDEIGVSSSRELDLPVKFSIGETLIQIADAALGRGQEPTAEMAAVRRGIPTPIAELDDSARSGALGTINRPFRAKPGEEPVAQPIRDFTAAMSTDQVFGWVETLIAVLRAPPGSAEFFAQAARALVELVGLDSGLILVRRGTLWEAVGKHGRAAAKESVRFSRRIVHAVDTEKRTFYDQFEERTDESLADVEAVVAAPILDSDEVVGIVYGSRDRLGRGDKKPIGREEAHIVQLLATSMEIGMARARQQAELARAKVQFELFLSPELAAELERNPRLLEGSERSVSVLFLDIRGFSQLAERLPPGDLYRLAEDCMDHVTRKISERRGLVVDYAGDGVLAMWNAPADQPDHADLACEAAIDILDELPALNEKWSQWAGRPLEFGIGINTGPALVGNAGSRTRVKYGPRGHTVNLGSRVEGATKQLGPPILITDVTYASLTGQFAVRRLCKVRVVGLADAVELFELKGRQATDEWLALRAAYELALKQYESAQFEQVIETLYVVVRTPIGLHDGPTLSLLARAIECLKTPPADFDPVWELRHK